MHTFFTRVSLFFAVGLVLSACMSSTDSGAVGVKRKQFMLLPSAQVDQMALQSYRAELDKSQQAGKLNQDAQIVARVRKIAEKLIPQVAVFRPDALKWQWEVNVQTLNELNAYCAPGGKIMFYTGIIQQLNLTDDEIAAIMGHEMAHALREHGRERMSQAYAQQTGMSLLAALGGVPQNQLALAQQLVGVAITLPHSRGQESEADTIGLELMARAGYNPDAAIVLWQKMSKAAGGNQPSPFLSTHPSNQSRIKDISNLLPTVMPLYQAGKH